MRWAVLLLIIVAPTILFAQNLNLAKLTDLCPDDHAKLAIDFLLKIPPEDRPYIRFLSYFNFQNDPKVKKYQNIMKFWINSLHRESDVEFPKIVPNSNDLLFWIDLRDYGWSSAAWSIVANREPYFIEPLVNSGYAFTLRQISNVKQQESKAIGAKGFYHCDTIVRADWFIRETSELDRSDSYFDLLFAKERFEEIVTKREEKVEVDWKGGEWNGKQLAPGRYYYNKTISNTRSAQKDFPKNEKDFENAFGLDLTLDFIKKSKLNLQKGAVVEGNTSIVARNNRLIQRTDGPIGWYYKTFDVVEESERKDFVETLQKDFDFDAGEILARLPAGGQAGLLADSKGKILKTVDNKLAHDSSDFKYDTRVRNFTSCVVCHESGIIEPKNLIQEIMKAGVDIKFKDKKEARDARSFFLNWDKKLKFDQEDYKDFIKRTSGFTPGENSQEFKSFRDLYDGPVTLQMAANEVGLTVELFKTIAARSTRARTLMLVQKMSIPRKAWETTTYFEMVKLMSANKRN